MKIFLKLICLVLVLGLAGPFILRTLRSLSGEAYLNYRDFLPTLSGMERWWNNLGAEPSELDEAVVADIDGNRNWGATPK